MSLISSLIPRSGARGLSNFPSFQSLAEVYGLPVIHKSYLADLFARCSSLCHRDLLGHYGCVNAIEFSNNGGEYIVSGGDDRRVVVWNVEKCVYGTGSPVIVKGEHRSNIFCAVFDNDNRHIFSAGNDNQALRHDLTTGETIGMYYHDDPVYGLSVHPEDSNVFLTACDDGNVLLWDARTTTGSSECIAHYTSAFHAAVFNPVDPHLIATANSRKGVQLWDVRVPKNCLQQFSNAMPQLCAMGLKWNMTGHMLTALRRRLPPVLYHVSRPSAIAEFHHPGYSNVCTMKSNCFAGNKDQYIVSGSDDFNVYIWEVPADWEDHEKQVTVGRAFLVLNGHRSIVNQVRFNPTSHMLVSAGVEKVVKVWSPFPIPGGHNSSSEEGSTSIRRQLYSHHEYLGLVHTRGLSIPYEHVQESTEEDPCMLAFFDSLIDREKNDLHSDSHESFGDDFNLSFILQAGSDESSDSDTVGISVSRLRDILYQPSQDTPSGEENEGVLRRLRHLSNSAAIRDLLHAVADTSSSSSDDEEEMEQRVQAVLPEIPRDEENEHSSGDAPVRFNRCQAHGSRSYRCRHQTGVDSSSSSSSHSMSDSSLSGSGDEHTQSNHEEDSNRNSPGRMEDSSISSSSGTDNAKHKKSRDALGCDRVLKQRKKRSSQERHGVSSVNGLQECETTGHTQENGQNQPNITTTATITQHENGQNQPHITTNHCSTADCKDRLESSCCSDNGITNCEANNRSQSQLNQVKDKTESSRMDGNDSRDESHRIASEGCSVSKCISNGCTDQSEHVPPHPDCNSEDCSKEREGGPASSRTKINGC